MTTMRVRDVLEQAHHFHVHLAGHFAGLGESATNERVRLLCAWLGQHEEALAQSLYRYLDDAPAALLDAWLQNAPDERLLVCSAAKALTPDATAEAVTEAAQASGDCGLLSRHGDRFHAPGRAGTLREPHPPGGRGAAPRHAQPPASLRLVRGRLRLFENPLLTPFGLSLSKAGLSCHEAFICHDYRFLASH